MSRAARIPVLSGTFWGSRSSYSPAWGGCWTAAGLRIWSAARAGLSAMAEVLPGVVSRAGRGVAPRISVAAPAGLAVTMRVLPAGVPRAVHVAGPRISAAVWTGLLVTTGDSSEAVARAVLGRVPQILVAAWAERVVMAGARPGAVRRAAPAAGPRISVAAWPALSVLAAGHPALPGMAFQSGAAAVLRTSTCAAMLVAGEPPDVLRRTMAGTSRSVVALPTAALSGPSGDSRWGQRRSPMCA